MVAVGVVVSMTQDIRDGHMQHNAKFPQQQSPLADHMQGYSHARAQELLVHCGLRLQPILSGLHGMNQTSIVAQVVAGFRPTLTYQNGQLRRCRQTHATLVKLPETEKLGR